MPAEDVIITVYNTRPGNIERTRRNADEPHLSSLMITYTNNIIKQFIMIIIILLITIIITSSISRSES